MQKLRFSCRSAFLLAVLYASASHAAADKPGRFSKFDKMAKQGHGIHQGDEYEHIGYTARQLQDAIHSPIRGTQLGGPSGDMLTRVQEGGYAEHLGIVGELFQSSDLDKIFTQPKYVAMILDNVPLFKAVTGVEEIAAKGEDMTPEDGITALNILREWSVKSIEVLTSLTSDPDLHLAEAMAKFETDTADNLELQELFKQAGDGNRTAAALAQKMIANHQLDGLFDMGKLGMDGVEAESNKVMRDLAMANPLMASFLRDIPEGVGFVDSPMTIEEQAKKFLLHE